MRASTRYGLVGIAALALLAGVHWLRDVRVALPPTGVYLLGVLPNFAAAIAITFVLLSIWTDQNRAAGVASVKRAMLICALISGVGLVAWEFFQKTSDRLIFDPHDLGATLVGLVAAILAFYALTTRTRLEP